LQKEVAENKRSNTDLNSKIHQLEKKADEIYTQKEQILKENEK